MQVSQFFKLFANMSKNDAYVKSIKNAVEVTKKHDKWMEEYDENSAILAAFTAEQTGRLSEEDANSSTEGVKAKLDAFNAYMKDDKAPMQKKVAAVESVSNQLVSSKGTNKRPDFSPATPVEDLLGDWKKLQDVEIEHERALMDKYQRFQKVDHEAARVSACVWGRFCVVDLFVSNV